MTPTVYQNDFRLLATRGEPGAPIHGDIQARCLWQLIGRFPG